METDTSTYYQDLDETYYLPTFKRFPVTIEKARGSTMWDTDGKEYIDLLAGIAVNNVGHCHPTVVKAVQEQAARCMHVSNFFSTPQQAKLSQKLVELSGLHSCFFTNSGAESVEGAIKLARKLAQSRGRGGKILSFTGSFHGRTLATIATGKKAMQQGFEPIPQGFVQAKFNDFDSVKELFSDQVAAILIEPIQGEGGINMANKPFLRKLRKLCDETGAVLIFDEIQCGIARTGFWFAKDYFEIQPDIMTLAKGLGGGTPIGAILNNEAVSEAIDYGDHGTTFGGNPLVCAAAMATLQVIEEENLLQQALEKGKWLRLKLSELNTKHLTRIKGLGLMLGCEFDFETKPLVLEMLQHGVIANATAGNILRLVPPLTITYAELEKAVTIIQQSLHKLNH